ncbi:hypothetical protein Y1Q_0009996 [Alligator mississippiensis]|uniref:Uncharacterized protein n=1 Tax=Alligator mississippiensis TaxID=8496 RepID=A0A151ML71_ALLMI|nr:hypothetical protein Y1Q_0009996 [Alligator mississippiensis]
METWVLVKFLRHRRLSQDPQSQVTSTGINRSKSKWTRLKMICSDIQTWTLLPKPKPLVSNLHDVVVTAYKRTLHIRTALGCQNVSFKAMETEAPRGEEICMETIQVGENTTVQSPNSCCTCT